MADFSSGRAQFRHRSRKTEQGLRQPQSPISPGPQCYASGTGDQFVRLAFSFLTTDRITVGAERFGRALAAAKADRRAPARRPAVG